MVWLAAIHGVGVPAIGMEAHAPVSRRLPTSRGSVRELLTCATPLIRDRPLSGRFMHDAPITQTGVRPGDRVPIVGVVNGVGGTGLQIAAAARQSTRFCNPEAESLLQRSLICGCARHVHDGHVGVESRDAPLRCLTTIGEESASRIPETRESARARCRCRSTVRLLHVLRLPTVTFDLPPCWRTHRRREDPWCPTTPSCPGFVTTLAVTSLSELSPHRGEFRRDRA
jgi:hypothetical protein